MSAPTVNPANRVDVVGADTYACGERVWVYRAAAWHPGIVLSSSAAAAVVRYRPSPSCATAVDTVMARNLAHRDEPDPDVDQTGPDQTGPGGLVRRRPTRP